MHVIPYFKIIGLYMLQSLELNFGKQHCFLAILLGTRQCAFLSTAALLSSMKRVNADNTGKVSWLHGRGIDLAWLKQRGTNRSFLLYSEQGSQASELPTKLCFLLYF